MPLNLGLRAKVTMFSSRIGNRRLLGKKAVVEVQFNWIFILIAGAAILTLFATIVIKQKNISEVSSHATLLKTLSTIAIGSEASFGVTNILELPQATIEFECNLLRIGSQSQQFQQMMLFAPSVVRTSPLIVQTREWSIPYRVTNVVYISSPKIRYILVGNSPLARAVNKSMHSSLRVELHSILPQDLRPEQDDHTRFIFFDTLPTFPPSFATIENNKMSALGVNGDLSGGTAAFYRKIESRWDLAKTYPYLRQEMLLGAIYSDEKSRPASNSEDLFYKCIADNMLKKVALVTEIYQRRSEELSSSAGLLRCQQTYTQALSQFSLIRAAAIVLNEGTVQQANHAISELENLNSQLQRQSCPLIY